MCKCTECIWKGCGPWKCRVLEGCVYQLTSLPVQQEVLMALKDMSLEGG